MEYNSSTYLDENIYKTTVWNITVLHILMKTYMKRQSGIYRFTCFDENVCKTTIWSIAVSHVLIKIDIKRQYGI